MSVTDLLQERGFIKQFTHETKLRELLASNKVAFYIGFDPTADSLHVGGFVQLMAMAHMQRAGHRPIALVGGGTGMIGDPSGKTAMRQLLTPAIIDHNCQCLQQQMTKFIDFAPGKAVLVNNADWLLKLNYVEILTAIWHILSKNESYNAELYSRADKPPAARKLTTAQVIAFLRSKGFLIVDKEIDEIA